MKRQYQEFRPEQFELAPAVTGLELDQEVASLVSNTVYDHNNRGKYGNNMHWSIDTPVVVDTIKDDISHGPLVKQFEDQPGSGYRLFTPFNPDRDDIGVYNGRFSREMQLALDRDERVNRASVRWTLGAAAVMPGIFYGAGGYMIAESSSDNDLMPVGIAAIAYGTVVAGPPIAQNLYRRAITNPNINEPHLNRAIKAVAKLGLPPMIQLAK